MMPTSKEHVVQLANRFAAQLARQGVPLERVGQPSLGSLGILLRTDDPLRVRLRLEYTKHDTDRHHGFVVYENLPTNKEELMALREEARSQVNGAPIEVDARFVKEGRYPFLHGRTVRPVEPPGLYVSFILHAESIVPIAAYLGQLNKRMEQYRLRKTAPSTP